MRILAHRGASGYAPENTFAAFDLALKLRADAIETDVHLTKDNTLILIHDKTVDRTTTGSGLVKDLTTRELRALDAGFKYHPRFAGERIPILTEFLNRYAARIPLCLELKSPEAVEPLVTHLKSKNLLATARLEFTSFDWPIVQDLHRQLPSASIGFLTKAFTHDLIEQVRTQGLKCICPPANDATCDLVDLCHSQGLTVRTWGAKTREVLQHIIDCRVDGTTLNHPDWITHKDGHPQVVPASHLIRHPLFGEDL